MASLVDQPGINTSCFCKTYGSCCRYWLCCFPQVPSDSCKFNDSVFFTVPNIPFVLVKTDHSTLLIHQAFFTYSRFKNRLNNYIDQLSIKTHASMGPRCLVILLYFTSKYKMLFVLNITSIAPWLLQHHSTFCLPILYLISLQIVIPSLAHFIHACHMHTPLWGHWVHGRWRIKSFGWVGPMWKFSTPSDQPNPLIQGPQA